MKGKKVSLPDRMISSQEIRNVIFYGKVIEDYPEDMRGHSCLMLGSGDFERAVHIVCSPKADFLAIITAYIPKPDEWGPDFSKREK